MSQTKVFLQSMIIGSLLGAALAKIYDTLRPAAQQDTSVYLIDLDGEKIAEGSLPADVLGQLYDIRMSVYEQMTAQINRFVFQKIIAKEKGLDTGSSLPPLEDLIDFGDKIEVEARAFFDENIVRYPEGTTFHDVRPDIEGNLKKQKLADKMRQKNADLKSASRFRLLLEEPESPRVMIDLARYPARGPSKAAVTLVEIFDYLCKYCQATADVMEAVVREQGDAIQFIAIPVSLSPNNIGGSLVRGAYCAHQMGGQSFWNYHRAAFGVAEGRSLTDRHPDTAEILAQLASEAGLESDKLASCLNSQEAKDFLSHASMDAHKMGANNLPAFYLNGKRVYTAGRVLSDVLRDRIEELKGNSH